MYEQRNNSHTCCFYCPYRIQARPTVIEAISNMKWNFGFELMPMSIMLLTHSFVESTYSYMYIIC